MTALAYAACILVLLGCCACAHSIQTGHERLACLPRTASAGITRTALRVLIAILSVSAVRRAVVRVRWAWRCRGCPPPGREVSPLLEWERTELATILRGRKKTARPEKSRT